MVAYASSCTRRDAFSTERLKGAMLGPDDMDNDRPADQRRSDSTGGGVEPANTGKDSAAGGFSGGARGGGMQESEVIPELVANGEVSADYVALGPKVVPSAGATDKDNDSSCSGTFSPNPEPVPDPPNGNAVPTIRTCLHDRRNCSMFSGRIPNIKWRPANLMVKILLVLGTSLGPTSDQVRRCKEFAEA